MRKYLVVFTDFPPLDSAATRAERFWHRLFEWMLKPGFRHCFAVCEEKPGRLLVVSPHWSGADLLSLDFSDPSPGQAGGTAGVWFQNLAQGWPGCDWHFAWCETRTRPQRPPLALLSCVSIIHHLLGLQGFALTPWQLYRLINQQQKGN